MHSCTDILLFYFSRISPVSLSTVPIVVRTSDMIGDAIVLAATWYKTADTWKTSRQLKHFKPTITYLILRDGEIFPRLSNASANDNLLLDRHAVLHVSTHRQRRQFRMLTLAVFISVLLLLNLTITILDIVQLYDPWISNATNLIAANQV